MNIQSNLPIKFINLKMKVASLLSLILFTTIQIAAQTPPVKVVPVRQVTEDNTWWYVTLFVLGVSLAGVVFWILKNKKAEKRAKSEISANDSATSRDHDWVSKIVSADKEMDSLRRHKKKPGKSSQKPNSKNLVGRLPKASKISNRSADSEGSAQKAADLALREQVQRLQSTKLPIFKFQKIEPAGPFTQLSISNDAALMTAIEQTHDEFEEDEEVRGLALRILSRFRTRNSVEALSQFALYDLSANLRSKAVTVLAGFDHESVFETILAGCGDPTREVRAAAARGLFRLSFDRSAAWTRIAETADEFRIRQATRAAIEADLLIRSFDRLTHHDQKIAYEAVALLSLMIKAGETAQIFQALETHSETNVKLALLHVIGLTKDQATLSNLYEILENSHISKELKEKIEEVIQNFAMIPA